MSMFRAKALCGEVSGANFSTKGFRSKRQSSPCIFQVIASLPMKALLFIGTIYTGTDSSKFSKFQEKKYHYYYYDIFLYQCFINPRLKPTFINIEFHKHIRPAHIILQHNLIINNLQMYRMTILTRFVHLF